MRETAKQQKGDSQALQVAMGEGIITKAPNIVWSRGLGSCVVVTLYDTQRKIGGLAHIMLPGSSKIGNPSPCGSSLKGSRTSRGIPQGGSTIRNQKYRRADTAIAALLEGLKDKGAILKDVVAKMAGGARMFSDYEGPDTGMGAENILSIRQNLTREGIPLIGQDVGGHHGRNVEFHLDSGVVIVKAIGREDKEI